MLALSLLVWIAAHSVQGDCTGPQMLLLSDDRRRTCTDISASKNRIEYTCASLIKGFEKAMIKYCPVEVCTENGTWSKPSISCALSECFTPGKSREYMGHRTCTKSGRQCQRWDHPKPKHRFRKNSMFPDYTVAMAEAFCRDPEGAKGEPWCFTTDPDRTWEFCDVRDCSHIAVSDGTCGKTIDTELNEDLAIAEPEDDFDGTDEPCMNDLKFHVSSNYRVIGYPVEETVQRTAIECAALCTHVVECRAFTFHAGNGTCMLHRGKSMLVKSRGFKSGVKSCFV